MIFLTQRQTIDRFLFFSNLHHLQSITADKIRVNLAFLDILKTLPSLTNLSIKETRINLKDAKKITQISTLEELKISEEKLTQNTFEKLKSVVLIRFENT